MKSVFSRFAVFTILFLLLASPVLAQDVPEITIYFFYGKGCPHCEKEAGFLDELVQEYSFVSLQEFEVWYNTQNASLLKKIGEKLKVEVSGVPLVIIGDQTIVGYFNDETTGSQIRQLVEEYYRARYCPDMVGSIICEEDTDKGSGDGVEVGTKINLPFFGEIDMKTFSLPVLTLVVAALDGFNPCAMWVLLFLISLLLGMQDRRKMWILGGIFIATSGVVYFLFLSAWLKLFLFLGFVFWIRLGIGLVAIGSGVMHLRDFWLKNIACKVTGGEKRQKVFTKLREVTQKRKFLFALGGIMLLAVAVNMIELVCSAGLPAIYTQVLSLSNLTTGQYYLYLLLYILIFILDDLFVFVAAMVTLHAVGISNKYSHYSNLIGGVLIFILGILLLFKPEWLMFG